MFTIGDFLIIMVFLLYTCIHMLMSHGKRVEAGGQLSEVFLSHHMVSGIELKSLGLCSQHFYPGSSQWPESQYFC